MSFTLPRRSIPRLNRSQLAVPGSNPRFLEKAAASEADVVFLDLEDSVAPSDKETARSNIIAALHDLDWGRKTVSLRINGLDTYYCYRDVIDVVEKAGDKLDLIMIPKVGTASDVYAIDMLLTQIEAAKGYQKALGIEMIIESALGMQNIHEIAAASARNEALHFGIADYAASIRAHTTNIGGPNRDYAILTDPDDDGKRDVHWGDMWHYAIARMVVAARANGLRPIDGPFGDFNDSDGYRAQGNRSKILGCEGKWSIHPNQTGLANELFTPTEAQITQARRILEAMEQAQQEGKGAVTLDGRLIDIASIKMAQVLVDSYEEIEKRQN